MMMAQMDMSPQTEASPKTSTFERELSEYLGCLGLPAEHGDHAALLCREHDFSAARAHLVVSRPGRHTGADFDDALGWPNQPSVLELFTLRCKFNAR